MISFRASMLFGSLKAGIWPGKNTCTTVSTFSCGIGEKQPMQQLKTQVNLKMVVRTPLDGHQINSITKCLCMDTSLHCSSRINRNNSNNDNNGLTIIIIIIILLYKIVCKVHNEYERIRKKQRKPLVTTQEINQHTTVCTREKVIRKAHKTVSHHNKLLDHANPPFNIVVTYRPNSQFLF